MSVFFFICSVVLGVGVAICLAFLIFSALFAIVQLIYQFPYLIWAAWTGKAASCPEIKEHKLLRDTKFATKLYLHWIFHKELDF